MDTPQQAKSLTTRGGIRYFFPVMKNKLFLITVALALPAAAGTATYQGTASSVPAPAPSLWSWFIGGSAGYLNDAEEGYYAGQFGIDTPWNLGGWNIALYAEVGYSQFDNTDYDPTLIPVDIETTLVPVTFNIKFERPIVGNLNAYIGGGLGAAFYSMDATSPLFGGKISDDETLFTASVFAGLVYNVNTAFELFAGARWMYLDDSTIRDFSAGSSDDWLFEIGMRFNLGPPTN